MSEFISFSFEIGFIKGENKKRLVSKHSIEGRPETVCKNVNKIYSDIQRVSIPDFLVIIMLLLLKLIFFLHAII